MALCSLFYCMWRERLDITPEKRKDKMMGIKAHNCYFKRSTRLIGCPHNCFLFFFKFGSGRQVIFIKKMLTQLLLVNHLQLPLRLFKESAALMRYLFFKQRTHADFSYVCFLDVFFFINLTCIFSQRDHFFSFFE